MRFDVKRTLTQSIPYVIIFYIVEKAAWLYRHCVGATAVYRLYALLMNFNLAFHNPLPSMNIYDILVGVTGAVLVRGIVYYRGKNAKKFRQGVEYGSARWGTAKDIAPYIDPVFENNILLTQTERLMMSSRPKNPKYARNKNVLIIGGSGSGKTRFYVKPNLMQMTENVSYVVTDPKGYNTGVQRKYRMYESNATFSLYSIFDGLNIKRKEKCPWKQRQSSVPPFMNGFPEMMNCKANRTVSRIRRTIWKNMPVLRDSSISGILQMMDFPGLRSIVPVFKP
jgi:hypothetical protein